MKLSEWRAEKGWTQQQLADALGCTVSTVARYESGLRTPEDGKMRQIFVVTEGAVEPNDFYDLPAWRKLFRRVRDLLGVAA